MKNSDASDPQHRGEAGLDARIAASLRRSFVPPGVPGLASHVPPGSARLFDEGVRRPIARGVWRRAAVLLAVAAAIVLVLRWRGGEEEPGGPRAGSVDRPVEETASVLRRVAPVGPLESTLLDSAAPLMRAPDLQRLYDEAVAGSDGLSMTCGPEDDLGATLAASYGGKVALRPEANQMLSGPFASAEWPTATILRGAGTHPSVLVAERETTHRCCVHFELPPDSGLNLFTWQLGDLVLTEISPLSEPQLLGYFEAEPR